MIKITKNGKTLEVTKGAFENTFKDQGWVIANGNSNTGVEAEESSTSQNMEPETADDLEELDDTEDETSSEEEWDEVLADEEAEKPISEMSKSELVAKAESLGIDLSGQKYNTTQLRDMIREKINE